METMAVRTTRNLCRVSQIPYFPMVAFFVGFAGDKKHLIASHHLFVRMAFLADLRVKGPSKSDPLRLISRQGWGLVEPMTIRAAWGVLVPCSNPLAVNTLQK